MRIAIAGGNGFVGRALTRELIAAGHTVSWLSHRPGRGPTLGFPEVTEYAFTYDDPYAGWTNEVGRVDAVVNLSGHPIASRWNAQVKHLLRTSRIDTNRAIAAVLAEAARVTPDHARTFVSASGIGIYGDRGDTVLVEDASAGEDWLSQLAVGWEAATAEAAEAGVRMVCVRTGISVGSEGVLPRMLMPMRLFVGGPIGNGGQYVSWIHIDDLAAVYRHVIETPDIRGPVNACAPEQLTMTGFARALGAAVHRPSWLPVPPFALSIVLGEVAPYTLFSQRASCDKLLASGYSFRFPKAEDAFADAVAALKRGQTD